MQIGTDLTLKVMFFLLFNELFNVELNEKTKPCTHCQVVDMYMSSVEAVDGSLPNSVIGMIWYHVIFAVSYLLLFN